MDGKTIFSIAREQGVSKFKIRTVILNDLNWNMDRFPRNGNQIIINSEDEKKIVQCLHPLLEKKNIPIPMSQIEKISKKLLLIKDDIDTILQMISESGNREERDVLDIMKEFAPPEQYLQLSEEEKIAKQLTNMRMLKMLMEEYAPLTYTNRFDEYEVVGKIVENLYKLTAIEVSLLKSTIDNWRERGSSSQYGFALQFHHIFAKAKAELQTNGGPGL